MDLQLKNKISFVTGASSGIGRSTALLLAEEGSKVALVARDENRLKDVASIINEKGGETLILPTDVTEQKQCENAIERTISTFGQLDILVNAAGAIKTGTIENTTVDDWNRMIAINLHSVFYLMQFATPHLIQTKGSVINVSSVNGMRSFPGVLAYNVSKAGLDQFTRCVALELADKGVRVNSVNPGVTITELHRRAGMDEETYQKFLEHSYSTHPLAKGIERLALPEDVSRLILFLASPASGWITGVNYLVDGGRGQTCLR